MPCLAFRRTRWKCYIKKIFILLTQLYHDEYSSFQERTQRYFLIIYYYCAYVTQVLKKPLIVRFLVTSNLTFMHIESDISSSIKLKKLRRYISMLSDLV